MAVSTTAIFAKRRPIGSLLRVISALLMLPAVEIGSATMIALRKAVSTTKENQFVGTKLGVEIRSTQVKSWPAKTLVNRTIAAANPGRS